MRRATSLAGALFVLSVGGCAAIAGYDFGSYTGRNGSGGSGGDGVTTGAHTGGDATSSSTGSSSGGHGGTGGGGGGIGGIGGAAGDVVIFETADDITSIAVDDDAVYFSTSRSMITGFGSVQRRDKQGQHDVNIATTLTSPGSLSLDGANVFFTTGATGTATVEAAPKGGGAPQVITSDESALSVFAFRSSVYWSWGEGSFSISSASTSGGTETLRVKDGGATSIAVDGDGLYWLAPGSAAKADSKIMRAQLDGTMDTVVASNQVYPLALATDAGHVFWSTFDGGVYGASKVDAPMITYQGPGSKAPVDGLAAFDGFLYYGYGDAIWAVPVDGGMPVAIRTAIDGPNYVAVDADSICYATKSMTGKKNQVVRIPR